MPSGGDPGGGGTGGGGPTGFTSYTTGWVNSVPNVVCYVGIYRDGSLLTQFAVDSGVSPIFFSEYVGAGTHTYEVKYMNSTLSGYSSKFMLQAMEFKR